jgi:hypothetical protein
MLADKSEMVLLLLLVAGGGRIPGGRRCWRKRIKYWHEN